MQRTDWAERHVEDFLSLPIVREFVYRSPMTTIGNTDKLAISSVNWTLQHFDFTEVSARAWYSQQRKEKLWVKRKLAVAPNSSLEHCVLDILDRCGANIQD